jgi:hypothetical protein
MASGYPDYEGGKQRVYLAPEWAAKEAVDKSFYATRAGATFGQAPVLASWTVTTGKTLYICGLAFSIYASAVANADLPQIGQAYIMDGTSGDIYATIGGNGGGSAIFSKPVVIPGDHSFAFPVVCQANHACDINVTVWGYLLPA